MLSPIKIEISQKLRDAGYRHRFFRGRAEDEIAYRLRRFRKERGLTQGELAALCGMKQSAISRIEQASYSRWNFTTLWRIAEALDVRVRVTIDDIADAIREYEQIETSEQTIAMNTPIATTVLRDQAAVLRTYLRQVSPKVPNQPPMIQTFATQ